MRQGLRLEPLLQAISDFLDDQNDMIERVRCDLTRGLKNAETGRSGLTPQQVLRSLVLMRIKNWNYREMRERIADGCTLRQFTDFYCLPVPRHDAFHRGFNRLTPETLKAINDLVVQAAVELGLEDGQKLRVDTTVVQTDIHHPTDNTLLWVVVRVVTRLRGFFSERNVTSCKEQGVKVVCIPQRGGTKAPEREAYEKSREFKDGQRFRAGIVGRISVLFRGRGMKRCLAEGRERFELWVTAAVLANNLMKIAALLTHQSASRRKAA